MGRILTREKFEKIGPFGSGAPNSASANVKHWHGAKKDSWFSRIAVEIPGDECSNEWC